ncbi:MAG: HPr kinase/phosphorylase [Rhodothalassiaceae bacterium]
MDLVHASCVAIAGRAVLIRGPSGSGKSDLALRLIDGGAELVADDFVALRAEKGRVLAAPPERLAGLIEVRGLGLVRMPCCRQAAVALIVDLLPPDAVQRLPEQESERICGVEVPHLALAAHEVSAPAKIRLMLRLLDASQGGNYGLEPL